MDWDELCFADFISDMGNLEIRESIDSVNE